MTLGIYIWITGWITTSLVYVIDAEKRNLTEEGNIMVVTTLNFLFWPVMAICILGIFIGDVLKKVKDSP